MRSLVWSKTCCQATKTFTCARWRGASQHQRNRPQVAAGGRQLGGAVPGVPLVLARSFELCMERGEKHQRGGGGSVQCDAQAKVQGSGKARAAVPGCGGQLGYPWRCQQRQKPFSGAQQIAEANGSLRAGIGPISSDGLDDFTLELCRRRIAPQKTPGCLVTCALQGFRGEP